MVSPETIFLLNFFILMFILPFFAILNSPSPLIVCLLSVIRNSALSPTSMIAPFFNRKQPFPLNCVLPPDEITKSVSISASPDSINASPEIIVWILLSPSVLSLINLSPFPSINRAPSSTTMSSPKCILLPPPNRKVPPLRILDFCFNQRFLPLPILTSCFLAASSVPIVILPRTMSFDSPSSSLPNSIFVSSPVVDKSKSMSSPSAAAPSPPMLCFNAAKLCFTRPSSSTIRSVLIASLVLSFFQRLLIIS